MKKHEYGLTGEGFTLEEATELYEGYKSQPTTKEERQEYLAALKRATALFKADMAEMAANGECNGGAVASDGLSRQEGDAASHREHGAPVSK